MAENSQKKKKDTPKSHPGEDKKHSQKHVFSAKKIHSKSHPGEDKTYACILSDDKKHNQM